MTRTVQFRRTTSSRARLTLLRIEDRIVPGETLSALLGAPAGLSAVPAVWGPSVAGDDAPAAVAPADTHADEADAAAVYVGLAALPDRPADSAPTGRQSLTADGRFDSRPPSDLTPAFPAADALPALPAGRPADLAPVTGTGDGPAAGLAAPPAPAGAVGATAAAPAATAEPLLVVQSDAAPDARPKTGPTGFTPAQVRQAYGFDQLANRGAGQTIAIVDAYNDPNIFGDLDTFDKQFKANATDTATLYAQYGPASSFLTQVNQTGASKLPAADAGWAVEISLDVEWAHAIAPAAKILLVEATSNSYANLFTAVDYAAAHAHVVSMSWGGGDGAGETAYDVHFQVSGVTFLVSSGDSGGVVEYPSASPYVVSVGGTSLYLDGSNNYLSESAWADGGGGASGVEAEPGYQTTYGITTTNNHRGTPDVAYNADPNTGVPVYDSYGYRAAASWHQVGGTSAGAPQWAGLIALADEGRATPLSSASLTTAPVYTAAGPMYATNYHDVTTGSNGHAAGTGYDLATGLGSPRANTLVPYLATLP